MASYYFFLVQNKDKDKNKEELNGVFVPDISIETFKKHIEKKNCEIVHTELISEKLFLFVAHTNLFNDDACSKVIDGNTGETFNNLKQVLDKEEKPFYCKDKICKDCQVYNAIITLLEKAKKESPVSFEGIKKMLTSTDGAEELANIFHKIRQDKNSEDKLTDMDILSDDLYAKCVTYTLGNYFK